MTLIGSVRDSRRMFELFERFHPQVVYHAAAHKHVPLMEDRDAMNQKSNKVLTVYTLCFYLFALGSFGIRGRWVFIITMLATTLTAMFSRRGV